MADSIATAYVQIEPTFEGVGKKLKGELSTDAKSAGESSGSSFGSGFASVMGGAVKVAGTALVGAVSVGSAAVSKMTADATANFGEFEQLVGGVDTLFGSKFSSVEEYAAGVGLSLEDAAQSWDQYQQRQQTVLDNAANAYKNQGMDANTYMETVTSFAAALNSSLGENQWQSANVADMAITDMADNAAKFGSSMESVQNAYMGFSKGNFTMLDNLKLGYGGTKTEMERLMRDAEQMEGYIEGSLSVDSFADVVEAINIIQTNMGIAGTTAAEAADTLQGSYDMMSAAWQNMLTSLGSGEGLETSMSALVETAETYIGNLLPVIETSLGGISQLITNLAPVIAEKLPALVQTILPSVLTAAGQLVTALASALQTAMPVLITTGTEVINTLIQGFLTGLPQMLPMVTELLMTITNLIIENAPMLLEAATQLILGLATGITQALPTLIPTIVDVVLNLALYLVENADLLIDAALQLMMGLATGLINALPVVVEKAPIIIGKLLTAFISGAQKLLEAGVKLIKMVIDGINKTAPQLLALVPQLVNNLKAKFLGLVSQFLTIGSQIVEGIKTGISNAWDNFTNWMHSLLDGFVDGILSFFGISSPSKLMAEEVGQWIPAGIAEGIEQGMGILDSAMSDMTAGMMSATLNPTMMQTYTPSVREDSDISGLYELLSSYLPIIAAGDNVNITLEGDAGRLFKLMQRESIRNTQLVGTGAVLSAT